MTEIKFIFIDIYTVFILTVCIDIYLYRIFTVHLIIQYKFIVQTLDKIYFF